MADFQFWLLLVGIVAGGAIVGVVTMDGRRRDADIEAEEQRAEASWIADRLSADAWADAHTVGQVLRLHREYLGLPPPDRLVESLPAPSGDGDADDVAHDEGDDRGQAANQDLAAAGEEQAATRQEAHPGSDGEQRDD